MNSRVSPTSEILPTHPARRARARVARAPCGALPSAPSRSCPSAWPSPIGRARPFSGVAATLGDARARQRGPPFGISSETRAAILSTPPRAHRAGVPRLEPRIRRRGANFPSRRLRALGEFWLSVAFAFVLAVTLPGRMTASVLLAACDLLRARGRHDAGRSSQPAWRCAGRCMSAPNTFIFNRPDADPDGAPAGRRRLPAARPPDIGVCRGDRLERACRLRDRRARKAARRFWGFTRRSRFSSSPGWRPRLVTRAAAIAFVAVLALAPFLGPIGDRADPGLGPRTPRQRSLARPHRYLAQLRRRHSAGPNPRRRLRRQSAHGQDVGGREGRARAPPASGGGPPSQCRDSDLGGAWHRGRRAYVVDHPADPPRHRQTTAHRRCGVACPHGRRDGGCPRGAWRLAGLVGGVAGRRHRLAAGLASH